MPLPEDVIVDLLPVYFAGEASQASRKAIEACFELHPLFAQHMRASQHAPLVLPRAASDDGGHEAIRRVRKRLRGHSLLMATAIVCTAQPCSFIVQDGVLVHAPWRDAPVLALAYTGVAIVAWRAFVLASRPEPSSKAIP